MRWPGSKNRLAAQLKTYFPASYGSYIEPFVGSGSVWLSICPNQAIVGDINPHLMHLYQVVKDNPLALFAEFQTLLNSKDQYNYIRANIPDNPVKLAARTLYLGMYCFNGLYRESKQGKFNASYGYRKTILLTEDYFKNFSSYLSGHVQLMTGNWKDITSLAKKDDLVYLDPPYFPTNKKFFNSYQKNSMTGKELVELKDEFDRLTLLGAKVAMTNSNCPEVLGMFQSYDVVVLKSSFIIGGKKSRRSREPVELLVRNYTT